MREVERVEMTDLTRVDFDGEGSIVLLVVIRNEHYISLTGRTLDNGLDATGLVLLSLVVRLGQIKLDQPKLV